MSAYQESTHIYWGTDSDNNSEDFENMELQLDSEMDEEEKTCMAFSKYWVANRERLYPTLTGEQATVVRSQMHVLYGGPFFYNSGSYGTEGEAVWIIFNKYPTEKARNGINYATFWADQKAS